MSEQDSDALAAERWYLQTRLRELEAELETTLRDLSQELAVEITPKDITPAAEELFSRQLVDFLRAAGRGFLADEWQSTRDARVLTLRAFEELLARYARSGVPTLTAAELAAAREAANDAQEDFERVAAETAAVLRDIGEKGGA